MFLLSIVVPTYNRCNLLDRMLSTIPNSESIEVVIVDDGSVDSTYSLIKNKYEHLNIKYFFQKNSGRAHALNNSILKATGEFIMIMDDDDYFVHSWYDEVYGAIKYMKKYDINGAIYLTKCDSNTIIGDSFEQEGKFGYVDIIINKRLKGDKKEVVRASCIQPVAGYLKGSIIKDDVRRVPTSLYWIMSLNDDILFKNVPLIVKSYQPNGLTDNILYNRIHSSTMTSYYYEKVISLDGVAFLPHFFCMINYGRFMLHAKKSIGKAIKKINVVILVSCMFYLYDKFMLSRNRTY